MEEKIVIVVNTGFNGAKHIVDTGMTKSEWGELTVGEQDDYVEEAVLSCIVAHACLESEVEW